MELTETTTKPKPVKVMVTRSCGHNHISKTRIDKPYYNIGGEFYCPSCDRNTLIVKVAAI